MICGCGLPSDIKKRAAGMDQTLTELEQEISGRETSYSKLSSSPEFKAYQTYAEREAWSGYFDKARARAAEAKNLAAAHLKPLIEKNSRKDIKAVDALLGRINDIRTDAARLAAHPVNRLEQIRYAEENAPLLRDKAVSEFARQRTLMNGLSPAAEKAKKNHPDRLDVIDRKLKPLAEGYAASMAAMAVLDREMAAGSPDYARIVDACAAIEKQLPVVEKEQPLLLSKLGELDRSYSKTLIDMNAEYFIQVGRVSWEESEYLEYPAETEYSYSPVQVDAETYEYFSDWPDEKNVAEISSFFGRSFSPKVEKKMWDRLGLDPMANWPSSDNEAEFFLKEAPGRYFHKYRILENDRLTETGWVEVDEAFFFANEDNLGMDLLVKPYGYFEEEAVKTATPQGMAYVGNPRYGRWITGNDGLSFWEYYGMYSLLNNLIGMRYSRPDFDTWTRDYRGRRPYYGQEKGEERYGSGGVYTRTRYAGSTYSRSGGFRRMEDSVRGAGSGFRNRGPGGGGK